jgi:hypothetical protein
VYSSNIYNYHPKDGALYNENVPFLLISEKGKIRVKMEAYYNNALVNKIESLFLEWVILQQNMLAIHS